MYSSHGRILCGDARGLLSELPTGSVQCCVTSPPYWGLRDYGIAGQIGLEASPSAYVSALMPIFEEVHRVLRDDGTLWLNLGDSYVGYHGNKNASGPAASDKPGYRENMRESTVGVDGLKNKDMAGIPWRVALALQASGWILRSDIIWHKPNPMPESVKDRPTRAHEYLFLLSKSPRYYYDAAAVREPAASINKCGYTGEGGFQALEQPIQNGNQIQVDRGRRKFLRRKMAYPIFTRNRRSVWTVSTYPFSDAHFATFPPDLIRPCILAGCPVGGIVLDPFFGSGTVGQVCVEEGRQYLGIELNPEYVDMAERRIAEAHPRGPEQASFWDTAEALMI